MEVKVLWHSLELWVFIHPLDLSNHLFLVIINQNVCAVIDPSSRIDRMPIVFSHSTNSLIFFGSRSIQKSVSQSPHRKVSMYISHPSPKASTPMIDSESMQLIMFAGAEQNGQEISSVILLHLDRSSVASGCHRTSRYKRHHKNTNQILSVP